jgi:hypothetical protein
MGQRRQFQRRLLPFAVAFGQSWQSIGQQLRQLALRQLHLPLFCFIQPDGVDLLALVVGAVGNPPGETEEPLRLFLHAQPGDRRIGRTHRRQQGFATLVAGWGLLQRAGSSLGEQRHHLVKNPAAMCDQLAHLGRVSCPKGKPKLAAPEVAVQRSRQRHLQQLAVTAPRLLHCGVEAGKKGAGESGQGVFWRRGRALRWRVSHRV